MNYRHIPKVELHLHLDCSLSYDVVKELDPSVSFEAYRESFIAPPKCTDLADYLTRAIKGFELMQTKESLKLVTQDVFKQLAADNVIYAEIRFAPLLHTQNGLTPFEIVDEVNRAVSQGIRETGIEARIILCTLRHFSESQSLETVNLVRQFSDTCVAGFDIAGDEAGYPIDNHIKAFEFAKTNNIYCTAHAGEARGAESVWETLRHFRPLRIGHGIRSMEDASLIEFLKKENIHLEVCPTSNIQTNVYDKMEDHTADKIFRSGVSMSINTDTRTISDTTLGQEYQILEKFFSWDIDHFMRCNLEAIEHAFIPETLKTKLKERLLPGYK